MSLYMFGVFIFCRGKEFERGWHDAHLKTPEKEDIYIGMFEDAKVEEFFYVQFTRLCFIDHQDCNVFIFSIFDTMSQKFVA